MRSKAKKSRIWNFFTVLTDEKARCNMCKMVLNYRSSSSNLRKHVVRKHPTVQIETAEPSVISDIDDSQDVRNEEINNYEINRPRSSHMWHFFTILTGEKAQCNMCKTVLCYKSSTSNLKKHLQRKHPTVDIKYTSLINSQIQSLVTSDMDMDDSQDQEEEIDTPITSLLDMPKTFKKKLTHCKKEKIDNNLLEMLITDLQPFSIVEDEGFRKFVNALNPSYELPTIQTISSMYIPALYETCLEKVKYIVESLTHISITIDFWTSVTNINYVAVTIHFIDTDFTLKSILINCLSFDDTHTIDNVANDISNLLIKWNFTNKIVIAISNNSSIKNAIINELGITHFSCFANTINLIVFAAIKLVDNIISKVQRIVAYIKSNSKALSILTTFQKNLGIDEPKELLQDATKSWISTFYMIKRFVKLEEEVKATLGLMTVELPILSEDNWLVLKELITILNPFENMTKIVSGDNYISASYVIVLTKGVKDLCIRFKEDEWSQISKNVICKLEEGILEHLSGIENNTTLAICTFLDPRFKLLPFVENMNVKNIILSMILDIKEEPLESDSETSVNQTESTSENDNYSLWYSLDEIVSQQKPCQQNNESKPSIEINRYLEMGIVNRNENPLEWWQNNAHNYPYLRKLVTKYFSALATSVPANRLFSTYGNILQNRWNWFSPSELKQILFLNVNQKYVGGGYAEINF